MSYVLLGLTTCVFEFAYVAWSSSIARNHHPLRVTGWAVVVAALSVLGLRGALELQYGVITYLAGVALGSYVSAYIRRP